MKHKMEELETELRLLQARVSFLEDQWRTKPEALPQKLANNADQRQADILQPEGKSPSSRQKSSKPSILSEEILAGTWFNRLGILAIMFAVVYFLKWSFDNQIIGELGRIVIGILFGLAFLGAGEYFQHRKFHVYGQGFTGGGIAILYFSIFAAFAFYHLLSQPIAFLIMVLITLAASLLAVRHDSLSVGILGIVGGFATPFLLSTGTANQLVLFSYVAILDIGVLTVAYFKRWPSFNYLTFAFTYLTYCIGYFSESHLFFQPLPLTFLTLFFLVYLGISFVRNIRLQMKVTWADTVLILLNAALYFGLSYTNLVLGYRPYIGFWAVLLGVFYLLLGQFIYRHHAKEPNYSLLLLLVACAFITLAIPLQFDALWISIAWALEAAILFILSYYLQRFSGRIAGLLVLALAILNLLSEPFYISGQENWIFLNNTAVAFVVVILTIAVMLLATRQHARHTTGTLEHYVRLALQILLNLLIILLFTREIDAYYNYRQYLFEPYRFESFQNAQNMALSMIWGFHAALLIVLGFWRRLQGIRWFGLGFLGVVILKVFLFDLSNLDTAYRIMSFIVLGLILLAVSWLYQRYKHFIFGGKDNE